MAQGKPTSVLERHLQTGIQVILVALIIWFGQSTLDVKDKVARLEEQIRSIQKDITTASADRYTGTQATRDFESLNRRLSLIERQQEEQAEWTRSLRDRLISVESDIRGYGIPKRHEIPPPNRR